MARESESYYKFSGTKLECLKKVWMEPDRGFFSDEFYNMPGLGALYSRASTYIFGDWNKCGELMGLAPYGRPDQIKSLMDIADNKLDVPRWTAGELNQPYIADRPGKWEDSPSMRHWEDLAWRVQDDTEKVLLARARWLRETTGAKNLCIAGGVALNCVANGRIAREAGFDNVWIQPAAGDDGIAIGCAYYGLHAVQKQAAQLRDEARLSSASAIRSGTSRQATQRIPGEDSDRGGAQRQYLPRYRQAARRSEGDRLVSGRLGIRPARARQSQPDRRSAASRR